MQTTAPVFSVMLVVSLACAVAIAPTDETLYFFASGFNGLPEASISLYTLNPATQQANLVKNMSTELPSMTQDGLHRARATLSFCQSDAIQFSVVTAVDEEAGLLYMLIQGETEANSTVVRASRWWEGEAS